MQKPTNDTFQFKITTVDGIKKIVLLSQKYYQHFLNTKTKIGDIGSMTLTLKKPTRSEQQLRYYAVIIGLIADDLGYTWEEMHEAVMILKFGTRKIKVGNNMVDVRQSVSNGARFEKLKMMELIEFSLQKAEELEIRVPSREELGYISN